MSNVGLEQTHSTCQAEIVLRGHGVEVGSLSLIEATFKMQADAAYDELGDSMVEGDDAVREAQARAGTSFPDITANALFRAASTCLQQRYLGICAVSGNCSGREFVDSRLNALNINRYKQGIPERQEA